MWLVAEIVFTVKPSVYIVLLFSIVYRKNVRK